MKTKKPTSPANPRETALQTALTECRRLDRAVQFSFIREICRALKCEKYEAEIVFVKWAVAGKVVQDGETGGVKIYLVK